MTYRPAGAEPDLVYARTGNRVHYLATGASTGGEFGLYRWVQACMLVQRFEVDLVRLGDGPADRANLGGWP